MPITSLVGPSAVIGAALGFGAQRVVQDLLAGFFVVTEKQYGFGDVVNLAVTGGANKQGTVEDVTLRVTKLRTSDGEVVTVPNGQIITATNLSRTGHGLSSMSRSPARPISPASATSSNGSVRSSSTTSAGTNTCSTHRRRSGSPISNSIR